MKDYIRKNPAGGAYSNIIKTQIESMCKWNRGNAEILFLVWKHVSDSYIHVYNRRNKIWALPRFLYTPILIFL